MPTSNATYEGGGAGRIERVRDYSLLVAGVGVTGATPMAPFALMPKILGFLGYGPFPSARTLSERLLATWRLLGWSIRAAA